MKYTPQITIVKNVCRPNELRKQQTLVRVLRLNAIKFDAAITYSCLKPVKIFSESTGET